MGSIAIWNDLWGASTPLGANGPRSARAKSRAFLALAVLFATTAYGHPQGFHKKLTFTLTKTKVSALIVMDVDAGERCLLLREAVDSNRDGQLAGEEIAQLKDRLVKMATRPLKLSISGAPLPVVGKESKVSLREDRRANARLSASGAAYVRRRLSGTSWAPSAARDSS